MAVFSYDVVHQQLFRPPAASSSFCNCCYCFCLSLFYSNHLFKKVFANNYFSTIIPIIHLSFMCAYFYESRMSSFISRQAIKTGKSLLLQQRRHNSSGSTADNGNLPSFLLLKTIPTYLLNLLLIVPTLFLEQDHLLLPFQKLEWQSELQHLPFR